MKKHWPKFVFFVIVLLLYFLPSFIFPVDVEYYKSLNGPHLPSWMFMVMWTIIYITMSIFATYYVFYPKEKRNAETKRIIVFLIVNYVLQALYTPVFFKWHNLFLSYVIVLFTFITILIIALESLLIDKKITLLTLPYIIWSALASVISILIYLQN